MIDDKPTVQSMFGLPCQPMEARNPFILSFFTNLSPLYRTWTVLVRPEPKNMTASLCQGLYLHLHVL